MTKPGEDAGSLAAYDYELPVELIAQQPAERRDDARLMVVERAGAGIRHAGVLALPRLLERGDLLVFNDVGVRAARVQGRAASGGAVELLFVRPVAGGWYCLGKPGKRLRRGAKLELAGGVAAEVVERGAGDGAAVVSLPAVADVGAYLERCGEVPLPPYIKRPHGPDDVDRQRYQTVFARRPAAVAAPTAGLHFSERLLAELERAGVERASVTLEVGPATFLPVRGEALDEHRLDAEPAIIPAATVTAIEAAKRDGRRVIAVGTTTTRALESAASAGDLKSGELSASLFIQPGHAFRVVDGLLTNFHLPRSTLLVMVAAFAGRQRILAAYAEAVRQGYRFYSYGDAMLIV